MLLLGKRLGLSMLISAPSIKCWVTVRDEKSHNANLPSVFFYQTIPSICWNRPQELLAVFSFSGTHVYKCTGSCNGFIRSVRHPCRSPEVNKSVGNKKGSWSPSGSLDSLSPCFEIEVYSTFRLKRLQRVVMGD